MKTSSTSKNKHMYKMRRFAIILFIAAILLISMHYLFLKGQQIHSDENWLITLDTIHTVKQAGTIISIQPPYESKNLRLIGQSVNHAGLHVVPPTRSTISKRAMRLRANQPGTYTTDIEYSVQFSEMPHFYEAITETLNTQKRQFFLADSESLQLNDPSLNAKLLEIEGNEIGKEQRVERIFKFVSKMAIRNSLSLRKVSIVLASNSASHHERSLIMVAMCRKSNIPARVITGLELKDEPSSNPDYWVEVYVNDRWVDYHPGLGYRHDLPINFVSLDKYGDGIVSGAVRGSVLNAENYSYTTDIMIERDPVSIRGFDSSRSEWYQVLMLDRLPSHTRDQLSLLMLLPIGVLLCALIRHIFGIHSYGVFTPTILALAVTYAEKETTALILIITMVLVYFGRPTFHHKMSRTPRLSIIFTLVATSMVIGVSILDYFSLASDGHLILLPIVIITSLIDSFYSTVEKLGSHTAFIRLFWTIVLTLFAVPVLQLSWVGDWILRYPESHLITLSLLITVSYYPFGAHKFPAWLGLLMEPEKKPVNKQSVAEIEGG